MINAAAAIIDRPTSIAQPQFILPRQNLVDATRCATHLVDVSQPADVKHRRLDGIGHVCTCTSVLQ